MTRRYFSDKTVIITGASSGIGKACAEEFASRGANIVLAARSEDKLKDLSEKIRAQHKVDTLTVVTDVSKEEDCRNLIAASIQQFGRLDILINNAGISMRALFKDINLDVIRRLMDVNFWGTVYCTRYAMPHILQYKGTIVGVSSIAGYRGLPGRTGYSASKFAMQGFLEALRAENIKTGINILTVCPGFTASNIRNVALNENGAVQGESPRDEHKMMTSGEVAKYVANGVEKRKRTIILTTQGKLTVFLNKWLPGFMDKLTYDHLAREDNSPLK